MNVVVQEYGSYNEYLNSMSKPGTWGDELTLAGAAAVYKRPINVVFETGSTFTIDSPNASPEATPLKLGYIGARDSLMRLHYVSLKPNTHPSTSVDNESTEAEVSDAVTVRDQKNASESCESSMVSGNKSNGTQEKSTCYNEKMKSKRVIDFPWLLSTDGGALCSICAEYYSSHELPSDHCGTFVHKPFNDWRKSTGSTAKNNKLLKHENSDIHKLATTVKVAKGTMTKLSRSVYSMIHAQTDEERKTNLNRLADFFDAAYFLFRNEIPHTTNYRPLLELVSRLDGSNQMANFMASSPLNATYSSHFTVREVLESVSEWVTSGLIQRVMSSPAIAVMADESTDLRTRNELSICLRFLENGQAVEAFMSLQQLQSTMAVDVKESLKNFLIMNKIPLEKVVWLAFDGAANMSGKKKGVQALLREDCVPNAKYIHCRSHLLHLAAANVADKFKPLKALFSAFNSVWRFFKQSPKRHNCLLEMKKILNDPELELVQAGDTRWTSNYRAVKAVKSNLQPLVLTLQNIHSESGDLSSEAGGLLLTFQNTTSILLIYALAEILLPLYTLTLALSLSSLPEKVNILCYCVTCVII